MNITFLLFFRVSRSVLQTVLFSRSHTLHLVYLTHTHNWIETLFSFDSEFVHYFSASNIYIDYLSNSWKVLSKTEIRFQILVAYSFLICQKIHYYCSSSKTPARPIKQQINRSANKQQLESSPCGSASLSEKWKFANRFH